MVALCRKLNLGRLERIVGREGDRYCHKCQLSPIHEGMLLLTEENAARVRGVALISANAAD